MHCTNFTEIRPQFAGKPVGKILNIKTSLLLRKFSAWLPIILRHNDVIAETGPSKVLKSLKADFSGHLKNISMQYNLVNCFFYHIRKQGLPKWHLLIYSYVYLSNFKNTTWWENHQWQPYVTKFCNNDRYTDLYIVPIL